MKCWLILLFCYHLMHPAELQVVTCDTPFPFHLSTCRLRTEALNQLVSSLQSSPLQRSALVKESRELLERYNSFQISVPCGSTEQRSSLSTDVEVVQTLSKSTQPWTGDVRQVVESPLGENFGIQSLEEQRLPSAQVRNLNGNDWIHFSKTFSFPFNTLIVLIVIIILIILRFVLFLGQNKHC